MALLLTGGAGYIGSHTVLELLASGQDVLVLDNLSNGSRESLRRIAALTGRSAQLIVGDVRDRELLDDIFRRHAITGVLHFAGLKAVGESVSQPLNYYDVNVHGSITLCRAMNDAGVHRLVFSSSATVYGSPEHMPITEDCPVGTLTNPYGRSKRMVEQVLEDLASADARWSIGVLRYFNPVGAHPSGRIGEDPHGIPNNLLPYISQVAVGRLRELSVFGGDYPTADGTGVRDYIHVVDLAQGHLAALGFLGKHKGLHVWNLGTGRGYSVLEMIRAFEAASGRSIPYTITDRRAGDIAACWSDPRKAARELGWHAERDLAQMMADTWRWQSANPAGYPRDQR